MDLISLPDPEADHAERSGCKPSPVGAEEIDASIREIASNAGEASAVTAKAVVAAETTTAAVAKLGESSAEIGTVVGHEPVRAGEPVGRRLERSVDPDRDHRLCAADAARSLACRPTRMAPIGQLTANGCQRMMYV